MPKRKREHNEDSQSTKHSAQNRRVEEKLFHGKKVLQRALKLAKGFERQKLGRRQKTAKQKGESDELGRLDAEIAALKVRVTYWIGIKLKMNITKAADYRIWILP